MNGSDRTLRRPEALTQSEEDASRRLIAKGMNPVAARQRIIEDRYRKPHLPVPARGV